MAHVSHIINVAKKVDCMIKGQKQDHFKAFWPKVIFFNKIVEFICCALIQENRVSRTSIAIHIIYIACHLQELRHDLSSTF